MLNALREINVPFLITSLFPFFSMVSSYNWYYGVITNLCFLLKSQHFDARNIKMRDMKEFQQGYQKLLALLIAHPHTAK